MRVANDGGLLHVVDRLAAPRVHWELDECGAERLPKTV
jgi:hypothetical protein